MPSITDKNSPYYVDFPERIRKIQAAMAEERIDVYLGSRLRTLSWTTDAFCPWRSFVVIPAEGLPWVFTFLIDAGRIADESWLDEDHVLGYVSMGGMDQISLVSAYIKDALPGGKGRVGFEDGMSNYTPEGNLTRREYQGFRDALEGSELVNAQYIVDRIAVIKDEGTVNRFREASRMVDAGHEAVFSALSGGGWKGVTETEIAGIAALAMRKQGSEWEWSFTGGNEIACGYRTGLPGCACTPPSRKELSEGDPLMVDLHATFRLGLGDHSHNYFIGKATDRQMWHAGNFILIVQETLKRYKAGVTPDILSEELLGIAEDKGFGEYMLPGFEHGIGMLGDEWRIGRDDGPIPYWTDPDHSYREGEMLICAMQYACSDEDIGFRYENPIVIRKNDCEVLSKYPLGIEIIK